MVAKILSKIWSGCKWVWNYFNGKKTIIGTIALLILSVFPHLGTSAAIMVVLGPVLKIAAEIITAVGLIHKAIKATICWLKKKLPQAPTAV
jgi:hypothetical protein